MSSVAFFSSPLEFVLALAAVAGAAFVHGLVGLGFPLIATPLIALAADLKAAILITVLPNIAVNLYSMAQGGSGRLNLSQHWRVALSIPVGSFLGTHFLVTLPQEPLKLLLAFVILAYLNLSRLKGAAGEALTRALRKTELGFGFVTGLLSGTVGISAPVVAIYYTALGLAPSALVQAMNLCFLLGKITQAATLGALGAMSWGFVLLSVPLTLLCLAFLAAGARIRNRVRREVYYRWLTRTLAVMALVLVAQVAYAWLPR